MPKHCCMLHCPIWEKRKFRSKTFIQKGEQVQSGFQAMEVHQKIPSAQRTFGSGVVLLAQLQQRPWWDKGKGCFSLKTTIGAGILSVSGVYFASRNLQGTCFVSFVRLLWWCYCPSITMYCFALCWKRGPFPSKSGLSRVENMFGLYFKFLKLTTNTQYPQSFWQCSAPLAQLEERPKWQKDKGAFHFKPPLVLIFFHSVEYTLLVGSFKHLVLSHFRNYYGVHISQALFSSAYSIWEKSNISFQIRVLLKGEHGWNVFQAYEAHCIHLVTRCLCLGSCSISLVISRPSWEKGKGCFSLQTTIGSVVLLLSGVYFACRNLQSSCCESIWPSIALFTKHCYVLHFHIWEECQIIPNQPLQKDNMFGVGIKLLKPSANIQCPESIGQV